MFDQKIIDIVSMKEKKKKPKPLNKIFKGAKAKIPKGTHKMPDGTVMSGKTHTKSSKVLKKGKGKGKRSKY
jgi:hypothetical protein